MVVIVSGGLHLTVAQVVGWGVGFRAVTSALPKMIGLGVHTKLGMAKFSN